MDHDRANPGAIGRNSPKTDPSYHRAYKACIPCRNKKAKCKITAEEYVAGSPCAKCRREMRHCAFTTERHNSRREPRKQYKNHKVSSATDTAGSLSSASENTWVSTLDSPLPGATHASTTVDHSLSNTMIKTNISNGNDALNLLFQAAQREEVNVASAKETEVIEKASTSRAVASPTSTALGTTLNTLPELSSELLATWNAYRFVRMGWLSAEETVWLVDMFFENMSPLSPVLDKFYANHANHYMLVTKEPMLACMILTISSRYHVLPAFGGQSRGYLIHQRMWDHCQHLLMRLVLGLEKGSKAKTRTLGSIEAMLLMTEWHPRALYAPPPNDGWDSDVLYTLEDRRDQNGSTVDSPSRTRWREDVIEPANRADRMCWMVLGCAMSLGNELGMFDETLSATHPDQHLPGPERRTHFRKIWLSKLLYVYQEQLSSRLGRKSMMPQSASHAVSCTDMMQTVSGADGEEWTAFMSAWARLTKIVRSISDLLFPSVDITSQIINSGRYISLIEHIQSLFSAWSREYSEALSTESPLCDLLILEYQSMRIRTFSLGLQSIVSRMLAQPSVSAIESIYFNLTSTDLFHLQEVIESSLDTLKIAVRLSNRLILRYCSIRVFLHITTASVFLLKALSLGVSPTQLHEALAILREAIVALRHNNPDDLHLGARYATLLEMHIAKLQESFVPSMRPPDATTQSRQQTQPLGTPDVATTWNFNFGDVAGDTNANESQEDWLSFPLDSSLASFGMGDFQGLQCLGDGTLDFLWNLGS